MSKDLSLIEKKRHSLSHLMSMAIVERFPHAGLGVGPWIENGWYQDYDLPEAVSEADFLWIEKRMKELIAQEIAFVQELHTYEEAKDLAKDDTYKLELIEDFAKEGETTFSFYKSGDFLNLCAGPHVVNTSEINPDAFKLISVAGAYWRGDEKNKMLTRIYGVGFETKEELEKYLYIQEEAKKRDHRKLGKELDLFIFSDLVGGGLPLWTPRGTIVRNELDRFVWELREKKGYERVTIPHITKKDLYETSGHWEKFSQELFRITTREGHEFAMKPMNCPHHTQIYNHLKRSYRDLPQRYAETTMVYRDEQSGELSGLSRVRCITQDDAHVFCRRSQLKQEFFAIWDIVDAFYKSFGFDLRVRLSFHDPENFQAYLGTKEIWSLAESTLKEIAEERRVQYVEAPGEAAMYGPKIDFITHDSLGRAWQVATIQLDMNLPERFDLSCVNETGEDERIVMIHAAIMGSIERFTSVLIEHLAGAFPVWLAPVQTAILPVGENFISFAHELREKFKSAGIRVEVDESNESVGKKIRFAEGMKVPYMLVVGEKEKTSGKLAVRKRGEEGTKEFSVEEFLANILEEIKMRRV